jgi:hypothetical protein
MSAAKPLINAVRSVLKMKAAKTGQTTKSEAVILVMKKIDGLGGPTKFGIGAAAMRMALQHIIGVEVARQFKQPLSEHATDYILPKTAPIEIIDAFGKLPEWIAIEEGSDAIWMYALKARAEHWKANFEMKQRKGLQTLQRANISQEIELFLERYGFKTLEDVFIKRV